VNTLEDDLGSFSHSALLISGASVGSAWTDPVHHVRLCRCRWHEVLDRSGKHGYFDTSQQISSLYLTARKYSALESIAAALTLPWNVVFSKAL